MLSGAQNAELYAEWLVHIEAQEAREAFCYLIGHAAVLRSLNCHPQYKGAVRDMRFINDKSEQPFSFILNKAWLLFYFRSPAVQSGKYSLEEVSAALDSAGENAAGEWTVKLRCIGDVRLLLDMLALE